MPLHAQDRQRCGTPRQRRSHTCAACAERGVHQLQPELVHAAAAVTAARRGVAGDEAHDLRQDLDDALQAVARGLRLPSRRLVAQVPRRVGRRHRHRVVLLRRRLCGSQQMPVSYVSETASCCSGSPSSLHTPNGCFSVGPGPAAYLLFCIAGMQPDRHRQQQRSAMITTTSGRYPTAYGRQHARRTCRVPPSAIRTRQLQLRGRGGNGGGGGGWRVVMRRRCLCGAVEQPLSLATAVRRWTWLPVRLLLLLSRLL